MTTNPEAHPARELSLYRNASAEWARWLLMAACGFGLWVITAHLLPPEEVGRAGAIIAVMTLLSFASQLGVGHALIRTVPGANTAGARLINSGLTMASLLAVLLTLAFTLLAAQLVPGGEVLRATPARSTLFVIFVVASTIDSLQSFIFLAARRATYSLVPSVMQLLVRAAVLLLGPATDAWDVVVSIGMSYIAASAVGFMLMARCYNGYRPAIIMDWRLLRGSAGFALSNHIVNTTLSLPDRLLPSVIAYGLGPAAAGYFYVAWFAGSAASQAAAALGVALFAEAAHAPEALRWLTRRAAIVGLTASIAGAMAAWVLAGPVLTLLGSDYARNGVWLVRLLSLCSILVIGTQLLLNSLRSRGRMRLAIAVAIVESTVALAVTAALLGRLGLPAAAVGFGAGQLCSIVLMIVIRPRAGTVATEVPPAA